MKIHLFFRLFTIQAFLNRYTRALFGLYYNDEDEKQFVCKNQNPLFGEATNLVAVFQTFEIVAVDKSNFPAIFLSTMLPILDVFY